MSYVDDFGFMHDKPISEKRKYPCNDQLILTAISKKIGIDVNPNFSFFSGFNHINGLPVIRSPESDVVPSRDFYLGAAYLGMTYAKTLRENNWNFSIAYLPKFNVFKTIASYVLSIGENPKFLWRNNMVHSYRFLFSVPLQDRAFYYRMSNMAPPPFYSLVEWIDKKFKPKTNSSKFISFLKYDYQPSLEDWLDKCNGNEDHPIYLKAKSMM